MNAVIIFPWGIERIIKRDNGAGLRAGLLAQYLDKRGFNVTCASLSWRSSEQTRGGIKYLNVRLLNIFYYLLYGLTVKLGHYTGWVFPAALALYILPRIDFTFDSQCKRIVDSADVVFIEYPFWVVPVR
ncbi:MAG TPA: hypothetical protein VN328_07660, partial [Thermodesulfovibrionales bacterium]|nr:hypothetical protein [Thermodesulfovibrionales bacterium]